MEIQIISNKRLSQQYILLPNCTIRDSNYCSANFASSIVLLMELFILENWNLTQLRMWLQQYHYYASQSSLFLHSHTTLLWKSMHQFSIWQSKCNWHTRPSAIQDIHLVQNGVDIRFEETHVVCCITFQVPNSPSTHAIITACSLRTWL